MNQEHFRSRIHFFVIQHGPSPRGCQRELCSRLCCRAFSAIFWTHQHNGPIPPSSSLPPPSDQTPKPSRLSFANHSTCNKQSHTNLPDGPLHALAMALPGRGHLQGGLQEEALGMLRPYMMSSGYTSGVVNILYWNLNIKEIQLKFLFMFLVSSYYITLYMIICSRFGFESLVPIY